MNIQGLTKSVLAITALLVIQFLLGMALAVFITSQPTFGLTDPVTYVILGHIIVGTAIFGLAIRLRLGVRNFKEPMIWKPVVIGIAGVALAYFSGIAFILTGSGIFSYTMAIGFVFSVVAYTFLLGFLNAQRVRIGAGAGTK